MIVALTVAEYLGYAMSLMRDLGLIEIFQALAILFGVGVAFKVLSRI